MTQIHKVFLILFFNHFVPLPRLNFPINNQTNVDVNNYVSYTPEELAQDQYFIQWVNATDLAEKLLAKLARNLSL
jgi:hypothetical protein